jgi:ribosomal protein S5
MSTTSDEAAGEERMKQAAERYTACVGNEAEKEVGNPAGVEDIAAAAQGRCWTAWDAYRATTAATYTGNAKTREEKQLATDRLDAHLRQFELDTRRDIMNRLVQRSITDRK